ncbi:MAG TPA: UvrB/UvrC motif-containing protein [candidate division Zixibacteria bacterium]|nr:UvrB/UvrC motif-containing protein [candidate division Zixibacteria bacterium]
MLCQDCKKREAQVTFTQIVNNEKTSLALCKECAAARGFHSPLENAPFPLAEIVSGLQGQSAAPPMNAEEDTLVCKTCGLTFKQFAQQGRFSCGDCYKAFRSRIEPIMRKIHGASLHRGRSPVYEALKDEQEKTIVPVQEEARLESELKKAIESEEFERAAEIRDKLRTIREEVAAEDSTRG